jgi:hypothetical protein
VYKIVTLRIPVVLCLLVSIEENLIKNEQISYSPQILLGYFKVHKNKKQNHFENPGEAIYVYIQNV